MSKARANYSLTRAWPGEAGREVPGCARGNGVDYANTSTVPSGPFFGCVALNPAYGALG